MEASRLKLHEELCTLLGTRNVYYDPPESVQMRYDAIKYTRRKIDNKSANNSVYMQNNSYEVTVIYQDADSDLPTKLSRLPMCSHDRHYFAGNLHHDVFTLYY
jgi:hypothetical protein